MDGQGIYTGLLFRLARKILRQACGNLLFFCPTLLDAISATAPPWQPPVSRISVSIKGSDENIRETNAKCTYMMIAHAKTSTPLGSFPFHPMSAINAAMQFQNAKLFTLDFGPQTADETLAPE